MGTFTKLIYVFSILVSISSAQNIPKLSVPRVLLPVFRDLNLNFTLFVSGIGCYAWTLSRNDLISIQPLYEQHTLCSRKAFLTVLTKDFSRQTIRVLAEDFSRGITLTANVILDEIASLKIVSKTHQLYLEEPPQTFEIRAYDIRGNEFTTLEGIEFKWTIHNLFSDSSGDVMRIMTFAESLYSAPPTIVALDNLGKHGHIALLEGIQTGVSKIQVHLPYFEYSSVNPAEMQVVVVENIELEPSVAYMVPGDCLEFKLYQIRNGKRFKIDDMEGKYELISQDFEIASISEKNKVCTKAKGKVDIIVRDMLTVHKPGIRSMEIPSAVVIVDTPSYITLTIQPFHSWVLTTGINATIIPDLYTENNEKLSIGTEVLIVTKVPEEIFRIYSRETNGTIDGASIHVGSGLVTSYLESFRKHLIHKKISTETTLHVYSELSIRPDLLVLPWSPEIYSESTYNLEASGGDNNYLWSSNDTTIVQVTQSGFLKFNGPGTAVVSISMKRNKYLTASSTIFLLIPEEIIILDFSHETEIWGNIDLHIMVYGRINEEGNSKKILFNYCDSLDFILTAKSIFVKSDNSTTKPHGGACAVRSLRAVSYGCEKVTVSLNINENYLETASVFCSYRKLMPIQPAYGNEVILAKGSSYDIVFSGGPRPIFGPINPVVTNTDLFSIEVMVSRPEFYVYRITCVSLGFLNLDLIIATSPLGYAPFKTYAKVAVFCQVPKSFEVIGNFNTRCPEVSSNKLLAYPSSVVQFHINILNEKGHIFHNASTIAFRWKFFDESIASFIEHDKVLLEEKLLPEYKTPIKHFVKVVTYNECEDVKGEGIMYNSFKYSIGKWETAKTSFVLSVVRAPFVEPNFLTLFNHPNHIGHLFIKGGSGHFTFGLVPSFAMVHYSPISRLAEITPQMEGSGELVISDKCLPDMQPIRIDIQVVSVSSLHISGPTKIQQGYYGNIKIKLFDKEEKPLPIPTFNLPQLGIKCEISDPSIAEFDPLSKGILDHSKGVIEIKLKGKKLGHFITWAQLGTLSSNNLQIQVFPRLRVNPSNLTLVVGSEFQITVIGGPSFDTYSRFLASDTTIVTISEDAIVKGLKPGHTTITAMSVGYDGEVYCKDIIEVHVIVLTGVNIIAPISKLGVGNTMPLWAVGNPNAISPLLLGSISPPLHFKWHASVPNIVQIQDTLHKTNIQVSSENKLSVRLYGLNPGHTNIELNVYSRSTDKPYIYFNSTITVLVFSILEWTRPNINSKYMLMAPNSAYSLKTNAMSNENLIFSNFNPSNSVVEVSANGMLKSGSNFGSAVIEVKSLRPSSIPQTLFLTLQVQPIHYLMINIGTVLETSEDVKSLPLGLYLNLTISYHDQYGTEFFVAPFTKPLYECNICSKIHVEYFGSNHSLLTSLASSGNVILRAYDQLSHIEMEDFIKIPVDNYILPNKPFLTVGEIVCFWTPFVSLKGKWSTDGNILHVEANGIAFAERTGFTSVVYSLHDPEPSVLASISLEVVPLHSILVGPTPHKIITNSLGSKYVIPVFLINEKSKREPYYNKYCNRSIIPLENYPYRCELHYTTTSKFIPIDQIFSTYEDFDFNLGSYVCVITPIKGPSLETSLIESNITLVVTHQKSIQDSLFFNFYPQFTVVTTRIVLTEDSPKGIFEVYGSEFIISSLEVDKTKHSSISVFSNIEKKDTLAVAVLYMESNLGIVEEGEMYVVVYSPLTQQRHKVLIEINLDEVNRGDRVTTSVILLDFIYEGLFWKDIFAAIFVYTVIIALLIAKYHFRLIRYNPLDAYATYRNKGIPPKVLERRTTRTRTPIRTYEYGNFGNKSEGRPLLASPNFVRAAGNPMLRISSLAVTPLSATPLLPTSPLSANPEPVTSSQKNPQQKPNDPNIKSHNLPSLQTTPQQFSLDDLKLDELKALNIIVKVSEGTQTEGTYEDDNQIGRPNAADQDDLDEEDETDTDDELVGKGEVEILDYYEECINPCIIL